MSRHKEKHFQRNDRKISKNEQKIWINVYPKVYKLLINIWKMLPSVTCLGEMNSKVQGNVIMHPLE